MVSVSWVSTLKARWGWVYRPPDEWEPDPCIRDVNVCRYRLSRRLLRESLRSKSCGAGWGIWMVHGSVRKTMWVLGFRLRSSEGFEPINMIWEWSSQTSDSNYCSALKHLMTWNKKEEGNGCYKPRDIDNSASPGSLKLLTNCVWAGAHPHNLCVNFLSQCFGRPGP